MNQNKNISEEQRKNKSKIIDRVILILTGLLVLIVFAFVFGLHLRLVGIYKATNNNIKLRFNPPPVEEFCGRSISDYCDTESDCVGGRYNICASNDYFEKTRMNKSSGGLYNDLGLVYTEPKYCEDKEVFRMKCGCIDNKCQWSRKGFFE